MHVQQQEQRRVRVPQVVKRHLQPETSPQLGIAVREPCRIIRPPVLPADDQAVRLVGGAKLVGERLLLRAAVRERVEQQVWDTDGPSSTLRLRWSEREAAAGPHDLLPDPNLARLRFHVLPPQAEALAAA